MRHLQKEDIENLIMNTTLQTNFSLERQSFLDALRGFAILGILLVNISVFSSVYYGSGLRDPLMQSGSDFTLSFLISTFFETKFYLLFSFLFGYSFTIQMGSAMKKAQNFAFSFFRRLLGLLLIGICHALFLYHGDILTTYALMGGILFFLRKKGDQTLILLAITLIIITSLGWFFIALDEAELAFDPRSLVVLLSLKKTAFLGDFTTIIGQHFIEWQSTWVITLLMQAPMALAMFSLGMIAGRRQVFLHFSHYQSIANRLCIIGLIIGFPAAFLYGFLTTFVQDAQLEVMALALSILTGPLLAISYIILCYRFYQTNFGKKLCQHLIPVGKTALSNYLLQSLFCTIIFLGIGFGLMGVLSPTLTFGMAILIFICQILLSKLWLKKFKYGPLEGLLRAFTKWQWR